MMVMVIFLSLSWVRSGLAALFCPGCLYRLHKLLLHLYGRKSCRFDFVIYIWTWWNVAFFEELEAYELLFIDLAWEEKLLDLGSILEGSRSLKGILIDHYL